MRSIPSGYNYVQAVEKATEKVASIQSMFNVIMKKIKAGATYFSETAEVLGRELEEAKKDLEYERYCSKANRD